MKIVAYMQNGHRYIFEQPDRDRASEILRKIQPSRFFSNPQIVMQDGEGRLQGLHTPSIDYVELQTDLECPWPPSATRLDVALCDKQEFETKLKSVNERLDKGERNSKVDDQIDALVEIELRSGIKLDFQFENRAKSQVEQRQGVQQFLAVGAFVTRHCVDGYLIINPSAVLHYTVYPGPPNVPANTWTIQKRVIE